jgi:hydroxyethylthiazole kinase-like uncharacterized protein yjeF
LQSIFRPGLDGDTGETDADCVVADFTVTVGFAKQGLLADRAIDLVGRLEVVPLSELAAASVGEAVSFPSLNRGKLTASPTDGAAVRAQVATAESLRGLLPRRKFSAYKNQFGRVGIVADRRGLTGAAILCASGALRGGAGLVELFVTEEIYPIVAASAPPEAMVKPIASYAKLLRRRSTSGLSDPGLGRRTRRRSRVHRAGDAADGPRRRRPQYRIGPFPILRQPAGPRLLTPHPGEMSRLFAPKGSRASKRRHVSAPSFPVTLLLKGSRTIVSEHGRAASYNTTGTPGMATGGMGDVLTGVCAALIAQKLTPYDVARLGAWVCGRAAEIAIFNGSASEESLLPTDVLANLGAAFAICETFLSERARFRGHAGRSAIPADDHPARRASAAPPARDYLEPIPALSRPALRRRDDRAEVRREAEIRPPGDPEIRRLDAPDDRRYASLWGWKWGVGFVLLLLLHECGHLLAAKHFGLKVSAPMFIPFLGAFIALKEAPRNAWIEAGVGIGGRCSDRRRLCFVTRSVSLSTRRSSSASPGRRTS